MSDENTAPGTEIPEEVVAKARALVTKRFRYVKTPDKFFKRLAKEGVSYVARDMLNNPSRYDPPDPIEPPELENTQLDPMELLRKETQLPALPQVFLELQQAINAPNTSADDLAGIISQDPSLAAFLLRMVNSAFYSLPMQVDTITRAVTVVGVNQLSTLAVGTAVMSLFKDIPANVLDMERFWMHSVACGLIARRLCRITGQGDPERTFVAGLLHDIGQLILLQLAPRHAKLIIAAMQDEQRPLYLVERNLLGFDHATLGGMLLRKWNFPFVLVSGVIDHHSPSKKPKDPEPGFVHCAESITIALGIGSTGERYVLPPNQELWESLDMDEDKTEELLNGLHEELDSAFAVLMQD